MAPRLLTWSQQLMLVKRRHFFMLSVCFFTFLLSFLSYCLNGCMIFDGRRDSALLSLFLFLSLSFFFPSCLCFCLCLCLSSFLFVFLSYRLYDVWWKGRLCIFCIVRGEKGCLRFLCRLLKEEKIKSSYLEIDYIHFILQSS